jgi:Sel1 repeat
MVCRKTFAQAVAWFRKGAEQGNADAQYDLGRMYAIGVMYANGQGVAQDYTQALMWSTLALTRAQDDATRGHRQVGGIRVGRPLGGQVSVPDDDAPRSALCWLPLPR